MIDPREELKKIEEADKPEKAELPIGEYIKQGIFAVIFISLALFAYKAWNKHSQKKDITLRLNSYISDAAAYDQSSPENSKSTILKAMYEIHLAAQLKMEPKEILKKAFGQSDSVLEDENAELPVRKKLIFNSYVNNYQKCLEFEIFSEPRNLERLAAGETPIIQSADYRGEEIEFQYIISPKVLKGADKLIPNIVISKPTDKKASENFTSFQVTRARNLAAQFLRSRLIEKETRDKVEEVYDPELVE